MPDEGAAPPAVHRLPNQRHFLSQSLFRVVCIVYIPCTSIKQYLLCTALVDSYFLAGATLANSSHSSEAISAYQKALDLKPNYMRAWTNMVGAGSSAALLRRCGCKLHVNGLWLGSMRLCCRC